MASTPSTTEQSRRPRLEVCTERLISCTDQLAHMTRLYQRMKGLTAQVEVDADPLVLGIGLQLNMGDGLDVPVTMPSDPEQRTAYIEEGMAFLGEEIIRLWTKASEITMEASQLCATAVADSKTPPPPTEPPPVAPIAQPTAQPGQVPG